MTGSKDKHAIDTHSVNCMGCGASSDRCKILNVLAGGVCKNCYCPTSPTHLHQPEFSSVVSAEIVQDPDHWIFDVACKHCGHSGAFRCDPTTEIDW